MLNYPTKLNKSDFIDCYYKHLSKQYEHCGSPTPKETMAQEILGLSWDNKEQSDVINKLKSNNKTYVNLICILLFLNITTFLTTIIVFSLK